jgi:C4-type Zn-finger protein
MTVQQFNANNMPLFCSLCELPHIKIKDRYCFSEFGICSECGYKFAEVKRKEWNNGWRPSTEEIYIYVTERRDMIKSIRRKHAKL